VTTDQRRGAPQRRRRRRHRDTNVRDGGGRVNVNILVEIFLYYLFGYPSLRRLRIYSFFSYFIVCFFFITLLSVLQFYSTTMMLWVNLASAPALRMGWCPSNPGSTHTIRGGSAEAS